MNGVASWCGIGASIVASSVASRVASYRYVATLICPQDDSKKTILKKYLALLTGNSSMQENWRCDMFWANGKS